jgi:hypothetical protein
MLTAEGLYPSGGDYLYITQNPWKEFQGFFVIGVEKNTNNSVKKPLK